MTRCPDDLQAEQAVSQPTEEWQSGRRETAAERSHEHRRGRTQHYLPFSPSVITPLCTATREAWLMSAPGLRRRSPGTVELMAVLSHDGRSMWLLLSSSVDQETENLD